MISKSSGRPRIKKAPPAEKTYRVCKNCPTKFQFTREDHVFCSDPCRKEFHRHGMPNFALMVEMVRAKITPEIQADVKRLTADLMKRIDAIAAAPVHAYPFGIGSPDPLAVRPKGKR